MSIESVKQRIAATNLDKQTERELFALLSSIVDGMQAIATKLDADAGVTATDFAATLATHIID